MDYDPNHPPELNIAPSWSRNAKRTVQGPVETNLATTSAESKQEDNAAWQRDTQEDIQQWGIAGRIWEAAYLFRRYLTAPADAAKIEYDPPCPIFESAASSSDSTLNILELGSGVGYVGLALAQELQRQSATAADRDAPRRKSRIILTDLENVCDLMQRNATSAGFPPPSSADAEIKDRDVEVLVRPLPWGSATYAQDILQTLEEKTSSGEKNEAHPLDYILCSDLVYFPHLLPPLLRSLLDLTSSSHNDQNPPTVLIAYKIRSLAKEEPFWSTLSVWFEVEIVNCRIPASADSQTTTTTIGNQWHRFGYLIQDLSSTATSSSQQDETSDDAYFVLIARRKPSTYQYQAPSDDTSLMNGYMLSLSSRRGQQEDQVQKSDNGDDDGGTDDDDGNRDSGKGLIKGSGEGAEWLEWALMGDLDFT